MILHIVLVSLVKHAKYTVSAHSLMLSASVGEGSAPFIATMITVKTFFACLAFSIILGDSFSSIAKSTNFPNIS